MSYCGVVLFFTQTEHQWILYIFKKVPQLLRSHNYFIVGKKNLDPPSDSNGYDETHNDFSITTLFNAYYLYWYKGIYGSAL